ncbi:hypothetical protein MCNS_29870 [Mycobacterium conspicuum]|jgi:high-affinity iron transporter|uniref:High-affinity Fe2+/Pb2+ permease n=2 Tax=Mycobacterium conspicuum TaxID=44010 RepID=A0A7I7YF85_9MYCO|nr:iron uptake transporter permease EfeU [Mycobacterium conspicuum]BBZ39924.1 hypothetical protein MCNS_29870 [Mycobacterium conspicuum]
MQGVFVGTFLIGLREGLEATLIVSIVGAFLKRNGRSTRPMFAGVGLAVLISVGVGIGLDLVSAGLPQARQEKMETVIGAVAVVLVTSMIIWMNRNAARLKGQLEHDARRAMNRGGVLALAAMAFLAVLKEGFETAVFLLAAAQTSHGNRWLVVVGGVVGILAAIGIGVGLYFGGLKINLGRFFRVTGVLLVLIAAGLVMAALRTAHEGGWVTIGQRQLASFSSWMPANSVQGALITGVFGIPPDPRLVEVVGWLLYTVPVLVVFLWPARFAAEPRTRRRLLAAVAAALLVAAGLLAFALPAGGSVADARSRSVIDRTGHSARVSLASGVLTVSDGGRIVLTATGDQNVNGVPVRVWQASVGAPAGAGPTTVTLEQLVNTTGGRLPVGISTARTPGPFQARWAAVTVYTVLAQGDSVVSAQAVTNHTATLTGGGLIAPKTVSLGGLRTDWATASAEDNSITAQIAATDRERAERQLWRVWVPLVLAGFAVACALSGRTRAEPERRAIDGESRRPGQVSVS